MFKNKFLFCFLFAAVSYSQTTINREIRKNKLYTYWGWNWSWYTKSDINFSGSDYNFTLENVRAKDRQTKFNARDYFNPGFATIPQYNFRLGYYFKDNWDASFGIDHMKYVVKQNQEVSINGNINENNNGYNGDYTNDKIILTDRFLQFEHTDGLNYVNLEIRHTNDLYYSKNFSISAKEGIGLGVVIPKTNTKLMGKERYDEFHLSGYGFNVTGALNFTFFKHFFFQTEAKGGFIDLPNVRTTNSSSDSAKHNFFYSQLNIVFGGNINLDGKSKK